MGKNRNQLVGKTYCASPTGTGEDLSGTIAVYIPGIYDVDFHERILKYADGANWMDGALTDDFAGLVIYVLDAYHHFKYITLLHNAFRGKRAQVRKSLYSALQKNDKEARDKLFQELDELAQGDTHAMDNLKKCKTYLTNPGDEAVASVDHNTPRSYTEAWSRKWRRFCAVPTIWSYEGALNLLKYKVYFENGGTLADMDSAPRAGDTLQNYHAKIEAFIESIENGKFDFSLFGDNVSTPMDGNSAPSARSATWGVVANCSFSDAAAI